MSAPQPVKDWIRARILADGQWFHRIHLDQEFVTPGWDDPTTTKLPFYGLPADMSGLRVLDIGCCEGFFSFEAERRGAREVVAVEAYPGYVRRFNMCRDYLESRATAYLGNVYDLNPKTFGTFDMVFFFGVLYHLRHPMLALEKILSVCTGTMLLQTYALENEETEISKAAAAAGAVPVAKFYPFGKRSGPGGTIHDPTVFWVPNAECVRAMIESTGFKEVEELSRHPMQLVFRAQAPNRAPGAPPDDSKAPWS